MLTASDTPKKRPGHKPKPPVARSLRRVRDKDIPERKSLSAPWYPSSEAKRVDEAVDTSLVEAQKTIAAIIRNAVRHDSCDHMALYMLQRLVGHALALTRSQRQADRIDGS
jgi:hypothetical protein